MRRRKKYQDGASTINWNFKRNTSREEEELRAGVEATHNFESRTENKGRRTKRKHKLRTRIEAQA